MYTFKVKRTKYSVEKDAYCWNLKRYSVNKEGEESVNMNKYYSNLSSLAAKLVDLSVDAPTKEEVTSAVKAITKALQNCETVHAQQNT